MYSWFSKVTKNNIYIVGEFLMSLEKIGRFIKRIYEKDDGEIRGITFTPTLLAGVIYGGMMGMDITHDPWDAASVQDNQTIVAEFNTQAQDIRGLHSKLEYLTKKQDIGAFEAKQSGDSWDETNMTWLKLLAQEKSTGRLVKEKTDDYMTDLLLSDALSEKQVFQMVSNNDFPSYSVSFNAGAAESLRESQNQFSNRSEMTDQQKAQAISQQAQSMTNGDDLGALGAIPGLALAIFWGIGLMTFGEALEKRGRAKKQKPALKRN